MSDVVHFPRHLARPPQVLDLCQTVERRYEQAFNEPWSALEARVKERYPEVFVSLVSIELEEPKRKWWKIW